MQRIAVSQDILKRINKENKDGRTLTKMALSFAPDIQVTDAMIIEAVTSYVTALSTFTVSMPPRTGVEKRPLL